MNGNLLQKIFMNIHVAGMLTFSGNLLSIAYNDYLQKCN